MLHKSSPVPAADTAPVKKFYETYPFPGRMVKALDRKGIARKLSLWAAKKTLFHRSNVERIRSIYKASHPNPTAILDGGCGTGELACLFALAFPEAQIQGWDLSELHLSYAERLRKELNLSNLQFRQMDLMSEGPYAYREQFDLVHSGGVLLCLPTPATGLKGLASTLRRGGRLIFMVYGPSFYQEKYLLDTLMACTEGRTGVEQYRLLKDLGVDRRVILRDMKRENKLSKHLAIFKGDFSYLGYELFPHLEMSLQMDGFFHPQLKFYDVDSLYADAEAAGLEIVRFQNLQVPERFAKNPFYQSLPLKEQFRLLDACLLVPYYPVCRLCGDD